ncbi:hypothetical protein [Kitasatospora sp. NPDC004289]
MRGIPPEDSQSVDPEVIERHRATSEWYYEFCEKYGVDGPEFATPEQSAEYDLGIKAIYERFRSEKTRAQDRLVAEWSAEFCQKYGLANPWMASDEQLAEYERRLDEIYASDPGAS